MCCCLLRCDLPDAGMNNGELNYSLFFNAAINNSTAITLAYQKIHDNLYKTHWSEPTYPCSIFPYKVKNSRDFELVMKRQPHQFPKL